MTRNNDEDKPVTGASSPFMDFDTDIGHFRLYHDGKIEMLVDGEWVSVDALAKSSLVDNKEHR